MIIKKPAIFIYTFQPDGEILREICAGIEELLSVAVLML